MANLIKSLNEIEKPRDVYNFMRDIDIETVNYTFHLQIAQYLENGKSKHKEILLSWMSDIEYPLDDYAVVKKAVIKSCKKESLSAALVLHTGGEQSKKELENIINESCVDYRDNVVSLLHML